MKSTASDIQSDLLSALSELRISGDSLREVAVRTLGRPDVDEMLREELNVETEDILALSPDGEALRSLPVEAVRSYPALPLGFSGGRLKVAVIDPTDMDLVQDLHLLSGHPILAVAAEREALEKMIAAHFKGGNAGATSGAGGFVDFNAATGAPKGNDPGQGGAPMNGKPAVRGKVEAGASPIVRLVNEIISEAIHAGSSDIHFEPFERELKVRIRQDGVLRVHRTINARSKAEVVSRLKIMANMDIAEKRRPQDGRIRMEGAGQGVGQGVDVRVSTLPTEHGEKVVLRILDKSAVPLDLARLGLDPERLDILEKALRQPYGMILMTGPTGAGKTTTLYSCINRIKSPEVNIVTVEDPIEYKLEGITQSAVKAEVEYTFANALRTILRQDPNVIMVGEIRDRETAEIAVRAALTGHLVLSTLHTNDAPGAVARLLDMGIEPFLLASALTLVGAQRLVRRVCPHCAPAEPGDGLSPTAGKGRGCPACNRTGYSGRLGLYEVMPVSEAMRALIAERKDTATLREKAVQEGMLGLREDGLAKAKAGWTTLEEVYRETA